MADEESVSAAYEYDVFLSFRGEDTRKAFTDHLYAALLGAGIRTFRDNEGIERGENIKNELEKGIMRSRCSIIILSKHYASSRWCLDELATIVDRKRKDSKRVVLPIFYHVEPSDVRKQKGSFAEDFLVHESKNEPKEKVIRWREALKEVADLGGMSLPNQSDGHEAKFIKKVVKVVEERLKRTILSIPPYLVGIEARVENINLWLQDESSKEGILVLCGMSGIGKTTIAKYVFNLHFARFEATSFLADIREASKHPNGLIRLQTQLLSDVLKGKKQEIWNVDEGIVRIRNAISRKKILLVMDDVDTIVQFEAIIGMQDSLYPGSKIIITTKNTQVLPRESCEIHYIENLNFDESTRLFCWHAFGQDNPFDSHKNQSEKVVTHCGGLPLALKVIGSSLRGKEVDIWKNALEKLETFPNHEIFEKLVVAYDSLSDDHDKNLFLDIACFFVGKKKNYTITVLNGCGFHTIVGIDNLVDRCLITVDPKNKLIMHQMIQEMGRELIRKESPNNLGKRTRLWRHKDSLHVLSRKTGTETITGLALDMKVVKQDKSANHAKHRHDREYSDSEYPNYLKRLQIKLPWDSASTTSTDSSAVCLTTGAFLNMPDLSLLQINYTNLNGNYKDFPKNVKWLCWRGFSEHVVPNDFPLESLIVVDMRNSRLEQVWKGYKNLGSLKILNLSHSHELIRTPYFKSIPELERLILKDCVSLREVDESIGVLETKLIELNLEDCKSLRNLPKNICMLKVIETFVISGCSNLVDLPQELAKMESLKSFHADKIKMNPRTPFFTSSEEDLCQTLVSKWAQRPRKFPKLYWNSLPSSLVSLSLSNCNLYDYSFPKNFTNLPKLRKLDLSNNLICCLPDCVRGVDSLKLLELNSCSRLEELVDVPDLKFLRVENCTSLEKITFQSESYQYMVSNVQGCKKLVYKEGSFRLEPLYKMDIQILTKLGVDHYDLQALYCTEMVLCNASTRTQRKAFIQVLFEKGITSIFLPGGKIPSWFNNKISRSFVSLILPAVSSSKTKIKGVNICIVYATNEYWNPSVQFFIILHNKTKNIKFTYTPICYGVSKSGEDVLWLSLWKFHHCQLNEGDKVELSVLTVHGFEVKRVGIRAVYEDEQKKDIESSGNEIVLHQENYNCDNSITTKVSRRRGTTDIICIGFIGRGVNDLVKHLS